MSDDPDKTKSSAHRQIPGYQILGKLGSGAMAVVYKAKQISLDRIVAIKVLAKKFATDKEYVERFYSEGQIAAKLNHPNIVGSIDVGEAGGYYYFVMECVEGKTVYDYLSEGKVYSETEALDIAIQMAKALEHAHSQGLIHRDVKPKNIMITPDGTAKLMDMGLARAVKDSAAVEAEAGRLFGTPYYISPEQILGKKDIDFHCDHYSLGATLYHMVTGRPPFEGKNSKEVMIKHVKMPVESPGRYNLELSRALCKVIMKMMSKHPEHRHETTQDLIDDLKSIEFLLEMDPEASGLANMIQHLEKHIETPDSPEPVKEHHPVGPKVKTQVIRVCERSPLNVALLIGLIVSAVINVVLLLFVLMTMFK